MEGEKPSAIVRQGWLQKRGEIIIFVGVTLICLNFSIGDVNNNIFVCYSHTAFIDSIRLKPYNISSKLSRCEICVANRKAPLRMV